MYIFVHLGRIENWSGNGLKEKPQAFEKRRQTKTNPKP